MRTLSSAFLALLALLCLATPALAESIKAGYVSRDLNYLPFFIAQKKGFYSREGIAVDLVSIGRADLQLQALITGDLHLALINPDGIIVVNEKGANLKVVAGSSNAAPYVLVGGKNYKKVDDLKGTRLGVASLKGGATSILLSYLKSKGLTYPRDFNLAVIAGGTPARLSALEGGAVAGAVLGVPFADIAIDRGFNRLGDTTEVISTYQFNSVNVNPVWAEKNRAGVVKFLKAHIQSLRWIYEQPAQAADFLTKEFGLKPPYAQKGIDYYTKNRVYPIDGAVTLDGLKINVEVQVQDGLVKEPAPAAERFTDLSYLKQAQKELGF